MSTTEASLQGEVHSLYSNHQRWLVDWLRRRLGCVHLAADLAQDTFVRVLTAREALDLTNAKALLTVIAKGLVVDHYRRDALERAYLDALIHVPEARAASPEMQFLMLETLIEIDRLLDGLPTKVRRAFLLSQLDGWSYMQIASELRVSVSSVQQYMTRAYQACYVAFYPVCLTAPQQGLSQ